LVSSGLLRLVCRQGFDHLGVNPFWAEGRASCEYDSSDDVWIAHRHFDSNTTTEAVSHEVNPLIAKAVHESCDIRG
jgi:hypothetical protein